MIILHIYGAKANFLLFCDHQDTESESREIEIVVIGLIFTQKISKDLWENDIHTSQYGSKLLFQLFLFVELEPFSYYFVTTKTLNLSHDT